MQSRISDVELLRVEIQANTEATKEHILLLAKVENALDKLSERLASVNNFDNAAVCERLEKAFEEGLAIQTHTIKECLNSTAVTIKTNTKINVLALTGALSTISAGIAYLIYVISHINP